MQQPSFAPGFRAFAPDYDLRAQPRQAACTRCAQLPYCVPGCCLAGPRRWSLELTRTWGMSRITPFTSPLLVGFDSMEKTLERIAKANDGYPPYNIERIRGDSAAGTPERLRITLAVAGFSDEDLEVTTEENQLVIRGRQVETGERDYLHRGIAARQFQRTFVLADGMRVLGAELRNGLLSVDLVRPEPVRMVKKINISVPE
ncbi:Small heat shock protein ibpA 16 kDa heat shock protein A [Sinorhizobium fredii HH103]|nr:Small heat shock protein ibpA 16 kDa heat shock protein A [Sinorhizobium fredii HH103]